MAFYDTYSRFGEKTAFLDDGGLKISYSEEKEFSERLGRILKGRTLVFCLCENSVGSAAGYLAFLENKAVPLLLDRNIDRGMLDNLLDLYQPEYIYYPSDLSEKFDSYTVCHEEYKYILAAGHNVKSLPLYDELGLLLTTSGSTGTPKLVRQSYRNIQSNAEAIASYLELDNTERPVSTLPMNYTYGLSVINSHVLVGATVLLTDKSVLMKQFWDFMKTEKATSFAGVPFTYDLLKKVKFFKMDLPDLRYITQAGGKLSPEMHLEFATWCMEHRKKFIVMYGQTEATARMAYLSADKSVEKYGSIGKAIPGGKFYLIDTDDKEITDPGKDGELIYSGDNVALGYSLNREDLAKGDEFGRFLRTGDIARVDEEGYYYVVGRKKRFLKIFGNRVNLDETDRLIKNRFENLDCASSGVDDKMKIFITDEALVDEVRQYLSNTMHLSESAFDVRYIPQIPKNEAGKTLYKKLPE